jgi:hypothetical protein
MIGFPLIGVISVFGENGAGFLLHWLTLRATNSSSRTQDVTNEFRKLKLEFVFKISIQTA